MLKSPAKARSGGSGAGITLEQTQPEIASRRKIRRLQRAKSLTAQNAQRRNRDKRGRRWHIAC
ncbi:MAG: hypothetical protein IJP68_12190 [Selenomonadaceae bacterium]|nr:hypothetical protein [Selenomonadaceae bacterium]MBR0288608.1 hypothetical protein [Selenomonadaceae bacterium]